MVTQREWLIGVLTELYDGARAHHWMEADLLAEAVSGEFGSYAIEAVDADRFREWLAAQFGPVCQAVSPASGRVCTLVRVADGRWFSA